MEDKIITCHDRNGKKYEVKSSELNYRPSVYAVIIEGDKILLSKQWDGYDFPGGGINLGETIKEALIRETKEETGLEVEIDNLITCEDSFYHLLDRNENIHSFLLYYNCRITGGKISKEFFDEHEKEYADLPEWISLKEIGNIKFYNSIDSLQIIEKAQKLI